MATLGYQSPPIQPTQRNPRLMLLYVVEAVTSFAATLLIVGIFFYTANRFGWGLRENFLLAVVQGVVYVVGALAANRFAGHWGRRVALTIFYATLALTSLLALFLESAILVAVLLTLYTMIIAMTWPMLESLVSSDADAHTLSRRIGVYNLVWSGTGTLATAVNGAIIQHWPEGVFALPLGIHAVCAVLMWSIRGPAAGAATAPQANHAIAPEPELLRVRTLALWLSRLGLPATYVVIYSLAAMLPSLPVMQSMDTTRQTLVGSVWLASRWIAFLVLGATVGWHTRPRLLLLACIVMLVSFLGVTVRPSSFMDLGSRAEVIDVASMMFWQFALGLALGLIYAASLYFGMVLSEGSTEHGGYHEALIGLGQVLGPGAGLLTQGLWPGNHLAAVVAVGSILLFSVLAAGYASATISRGRAME